VDEADGSDIGRETTTSFGVAGWILVSRVTGLLRVVVAGAVLGPTFFANIFQATNSVPNFTFNLLAGSVLTSLIVPVLVAGLDEQGLDRARQLLSHLVGAVIAGSLAAAAVALLVSPVIVRLLTLGVHGEAALQRAQHACWVLLFLVLPQIALYGIVAVAVGAQNARGHFALAAAAPALENLGLITTLLVVRAMFGGDTTNVSDGYLLVLGVGATASVALHAAVQCIGAARAGLPLRPGWGWHDPAVRQLVRRLVPGMGTATLDASWLFILIIAAGTVPGGVVALQVGINFYYLPVALSAKAVGAVLLPRLAREALRHHLTAFRETYERGVSWSWFVAVPAALSLLLCAHPIADSIAFGEMRRGDGIALLSASIAGLGLALLGATVYEFGKQACYARHDVIAPLVACAILVGLVLVGAPVAAAALNGSAVLVGLGVIMTLGELVRSLVCDRAACRGTPGARDRRVRNLARHVGVALLTITPAAALGRLAQDAVGGHAGAVVGVAVALGCGLGAYVAAQAMLGAPELPPNRVTAWRCGRSAA
jgi:putative peptidoglycan lipid II flippase